MLETLYAALPLVLFAAIIYAVFKSLGKNKKDQTKKAEEFSANINEELKKGLDGLKERLEHKNFPEEDDPAFWDEFDKSVRRAILDVTNSLNIYNRSPKQLDGGQTFHIHEFDQPDVECELVNVRQEAHTSTLHLTVQIYVDYELKSKDEAPEKRNLFFWKTLKRDIRNAILKETLPVHKIDRISQPAITTSHHPISDYEEVIGAYITIDIEFLKQK